jgi:hypothetical protein
MASSLDTDSIHATAAEVTLDLYSGKPNPTWRLSEEDTRALIARLAALTRARAEAPEFDGLGYRAVRADLRDGGEIAGRVSISRGIVTLEQDGKRAQFEDSDRSFELWLVKTGGGHLSPDVLAYVTKEITRSP